MEAADDPLRLVMTTVQLCVIWLPSMLTKVAVQEALIQILGSPVAPTG